MLISNKHKFIFIRNRKVAGSTVEHLLEPYLGPEDISTKNVEDGHMSYKRASSLFPRVFDSYYKFAIERNPWEKCVSAYEWHKQIKPGKVKGLSFEEYMDKYPNMLPCDWHKYADYNNNIMVDDVFTVENIGELFGMLRNKFNIDIPEEIHYNTRLKQIKRDHYSTYHTEKTKAMVELFFRNEIKHFGWEYEQR